MPRKKSIKQEVAEELEIAAEVAAPSEKERLLALYQTLKELNIRSISDLENLIARA